MSRSRRPSNEEREELHQESVGPREGFLGLTREGRLTAFELGDHLISKPPIQSGADDAAAAAQKRGPEVLLADGAQHVHSGQLEQPVDCVLPGGQRRAAQIVAADEQGCACAWALGLDVPE